MSSQKDKEPSTIQFRPLTEGLGLNHFSDGLPYSSHSAIRGSKGLKQQQAQGPTPPPRLIVPPNLTEATFATVSSTIAAAVKKEAEPFSDVLFPAPRMARVLAYLIDIFILSTLYCAVVFTAFAMNGYGYKNILSMVPSRAFLQPSLLLFVVFYFGYFFVLELAWRKSLGKAILGIRVEARSILAVLARSIFFFFSTLPLGIGLLWSFFDARGRCWHDVVSDSDVVSEDERLVS
jgi:uncharacterized RDD family membrane protein YckC